MKLLKLYEGVLNEGNGQHCVGQIEHILANSKTTRIDFIEGIKELKKCVSSHPEIVQSDGEAFRGIHMSLSDLLVQYEDITDDKKNGGLFNFVYKSKSPIQGWSLEKSDVEKSLMQSPDLTYVINKFKQGNGDITELMNNLDVITVPVIIRLDSSSDDFLLKGEYFKYISDDKDDLFRINNQPTKVDGVIIESIFDIVYSMLTSIVQYKVDKTK